MGNTEIEQMKRKSDGTAFYPRTILEAVVDKESNIQLDDIVRSINCIYLPQVQFENITDDLFATRCLIPRKFRRKMMFVTRIDSNGKLVLEYYTGSTVEDHAWGDSRFWQPLVDSDGNTVVIRSETIQGDTLTFDRPANKLWIEKTGTDERQPAGEPLTFFKMVPNVGQNYFTLYGTKDPEFESWTDSQWRQDGIFLGNVTNLLKVWRYFSTMADAVSAKASVPESGLVGIMEDGVWQLYANESEGYIRLGGVSVTPSEVISSSMFEDNMRNDESAPSCLAVYNFFSDLVKNGVLTIKRNGQTVGSFSANSQTNAEVNIEVPDIKKSSGESLVLDNEAVVEDPNDKVVVIDETNKNSVVKYPSVKALVDFVDKKTNSTEIIAEASNLSEFLQFVWDRAHDSDKTKKYRLYINGIIDFTKPDTAEIVVTRNGGTSNVTLLSSEIRSELIGGQSLYEPTTKTYCFGQVLKNTIIIGKSTGCVLLTSYLRKSKNTDNVDIYTGDTFCLEAKDLCLENLTIGGTISQWLTQGTDKYYNEVEIVNNNEQFVSVIDRIHSANGGYLIDWQRPLFSTMDNFNYKLTNCTIVCLGHFAGVYGENNETLSSTGANYSDLKIPNRRKYNLLIKGVSTSESWQSYFHSFLTFLECKFIAGCCGKEGENYVTNAPVYLDFTSVDDSGYTDKNKTLTISKLSKEISDKLTFSSGSKLSDSDFEKGLVDFYINDIQHNQAWHVTNDCTAIVRSNLGINMCSNIFATDILISDTSDPRGYKTLQEKLDALSN